MVEICAYRPKGYKCAGALKVWDDGVLVLAISWRLVRVIFISG